MIYVYAPSMATIVYAAERWFWHEMHVISPNPAIIKLCKQLDIPVTSIKRNIDSSIRGLIRYRKYINQIAAGFKDCDFIFCFYGFDYWGLYFIKQLNKSNKVYFNNLDISYPKKKKKNYRDIIDLLLLKVVTQLPLTFFEISANRYFVGLTTDWLTATYNPVKLKADNSVYKKNQEHIRIAYDIPDYNWIFIDQGNIAFNIPDDVASIIVGLEKLIFKKHPGFDVSNELFLKCTMVAEEIPVQFLINEDTCVITIASTSTIDSKSQNIISIINLVKWYELEQQKKYLKLLRSHIRIPNTLEQLKKEFHSLTI
ncbi:MAG: hypothetical protein ACP5DZ_07390 [Bacteroidales bacterium]